MQDIYCCDYILIDGSSWVNSFSCTVLTFFLCVIWEHLFSLSCSVFGQHVVCVARSHLHSPIDCSQLELQYIDIDAIFHTVDVMNEIRGKTNEGKMQICKQIKLTWFNMIFKMYLFKMIFIEYLYIFKLYWYKTNGGKCKYSNKHNCI